MFCPIKTKSTGRAPEGRVADTCCTFGSVRQSHSSLGPGDIYRLSLWVSPMDRTESALCRLARLSNETTRYGIRCARTNASTPPSPVLPDDVSGVSRFPRLSRLPHVNVPRPIWRRGGYFVLGEIVETAVEFSLNLRSRLLPWLRSSSVHKSAVHRHVRKTFAKASFTGTSESRISSEALFCSELKS